MQLVYRALAEEQPSQVWQAVFKHGWTGWKHWFDQKAHDDLPDLDACRKALQRYMPEYVSIWEAQLAQLDEDEKVARFLSFWQPPRYLVNCSQAVLVEDNATPVLVRNYDLDPRLNESTLLCTNWTGGRKVMGMIEAMSGLSDGVNDAGLAASLTFGGRVNVGKGFGVPLVMRYLLEMCVDVQDAIEVLRAVPSHMSYNVTLLDKQGDFATVYLAPDRPTMVTKQAYTTNHQIGVEWPAHARLSETVERAKHLETHLPSIKDENTLKQCFLQAPMYRTEHHKGFGTVYTAMYRPERGDVQLLWPGQPVVQQSIHDFKTAKQVVTYGAHAPGTPVLAPKKQSVVPETASPLGIHSIEGVDWEKPADIERFWRGYAVSWYEQYLNTDFKQP